MPWLYILAACIRVSNFFSFLANSLMSSLYIYRLILHLQDYLCLFLSMWLSAIIAIISYGDSVSPWILNSAKLFHPADNSTYEFFMASSIDFITLPHILFFTWPYHMTFCSQSTLTFYVSFCSLWGCVNPCKVDPLFYLFPRGMRSVLYGTVRGVVNQLLWIYRCWEEFLLGGLFGLEALSFGYPFEYIFSSYLFIYSSRHIIITISYFWL